MALDMNEKKVTGQFCRFLSGTACPSAAVSELVRECGDCRQFEQVADVQVLQEALRRCQKTVSERDRQILREHDEFIQHTGEIEVVLAQLCQGDPTARIDTASTNPVMQNLASSLNQLAVTMQEMVDDSHEMAIGLCEHYDTLVKLANGQFDVRSPENSSNELVAKLGSLINLEAETLLMMIEELQRTDNELKVSHQKLQDIIEFLPDATFVIDADKRVIAWNQAMAQMTGIGKQELLGKGDYAYGTPFYGSPQPALIDFIDDDTNEFGARYQYIERKGNTLFAETFLPGFRGGAGIHIWVTASPIFDHDGNRVGAIESVRDITDRKRADEERQRFEQQLLHTQKLESLGVLAGGIAHDFNNILMAILGNADLALMRINPESPAVSNLRRIEQAAVSAADLAKQMLAYSGKGKFIIEQIDCNNLLEDMLHMLEVSISKKAVLHFNLKRPLPRVECDATQIHQVIMNLVINASEAIGDTSGVIAVSTGQIQCDRRYLKDAWLNDSMEEGLYVSIEVSDTGCGMDKDTLEKIFDPFFTTKFTGRGLGMAAVLGIVRGHKGAIRVYSESGKGTSFKILLPASEKVVINSENETDQCSGAARGTVLLVDDEDTLRDIGTEMLKELGYDVVTANDGRDALAVYSANRDIDLVILDLTMPHLDGEACFRELRLIKPDVKVIISSGFSEQDVSQKFAGRGLAGFIQKPYRLSRLKEAIRAVHP
jgi:signal transduction histidine kinase